VTPALLLVHFALSVYKFFDFFTADSLCSSSCSPPSPPQKGKGKGKASVSTDKHSQYITSMYCTDVCAKKRLHNFTCGYCVSVCVQRACNIRF